MKSYNYSPESCPSQFSSQSEYVFVNSEELKALLDDSGRSNSNLLKRVQWQQVWQFLLNAIVPSSDPKIYQKRDRQGNIYFRVYDPATGSTSVFATEKEVRIWLDQRYYQA